MKCWSWQIYEYNVLQRMMMVTATKCANLRESTVEFRCYGYCEARLSKFGRTRIAKLEKHRVKYVTWKNQSVKREEEYKTLCINSGVSCRKFTIWSVSGRTLRSSFGSKGGASRRRTARHSCCTGRKGWRPAQQPASSRPSRSWGACTHPPCATGRSCDTWS